MFSGIANACLLQFRQRHHPGRNYVLSGEDLTTIGPVSLLQDLATAATLGIDHVERNGHHYFRGLSMFPEACRDQVLTHHDDLYRTLADGVPSLDIEDGEICLTSVIEAPFGVEADVDLTKFEPLREWSVESLGLSPNQQ